MKYCFGVDIGGTTIKMGLFTAEGELLDKWEITTRRENGGEKVPQDIADAIAKKCVDKNIEKSDITGVGIGVPGPVRNDGTVMKCANLGWGIFNVNEKMSELTGLKCQALNDANAAALGELWRGSGKGFKNLVFITLGTGVGGGIVIDGKIIAGIHGGGGEIGHIVVNPKEDAVCGCGGHGHLEQYASATGIVRLAKKGLQDKSVNTVLREKEAELTCKDIFDAAKSGDAFANGLVDEMCSYLALALSGVAATCDPEAYVIGGGVSKAGEIITDTVKKHFYSNNMNVLTQSEFRLASLGNDAGIYGAAYMTI
ncbi:MAG: ROK family glucokinase [Lachnospiraceae bacterium]|jgi:glucokinase|nr:ROK family glucokinase [Lachnospiraceae bacterium]